MLFINHKFNQCSIMNANDGNKRKRKSSGQLSKKKILASSNLFLLPSHSSNSFNGTLEGKIISCPRLPNVSHWLVEWDSTTTSNNENIPLSQLCSTIPKDSAG